MTITALVTIMQSENYYYVAGIVVVVGDADDDDGDDDDDKVIVGDQESDYDGYVYNDDDGDDNDRNDDVDDDGADATLITATSAIFLVIDVPTQLLSLQPSTRSREAHAGGAHNARMISTALEPRRRQSSFRLATLRTILPAPTASMSSTAFHPNEYG